MLNIIVLLYLCKYTYSLSEQCYTATLLVLLSYNCITQVNNKKWYTM